MDRQEQAIKHAIETSLLIVICGAMASIYASLIGG